MSQYRWVGYEDLVELGDPPSNHYGGDMYSPQPEGWYVVGWSIPDGWVVKAPAGTVWAYNGHAWVSGPDIAPPNGVPGAATLAAARDFAEQLIGEHRAPRRHRVT